MRGTAASVLIGALAVALSGCVHTTAGVAHRAGGTSSTTVTDLESFLLEPDHIDKIVGSHGQAVRIATEIVSKIK